MPITVNVIRHALISCSSSQRNLNMYPLNPRVGPRFDAHPLVATVAILIVGLAGCASELTSRPNSLPADAAPYVGVFTGEFVDGKPLYRFPTIEVVGSRGDIGPGT
jgi:hypothetical protein